MHSGLGNWFTPASNPTNAGAEPAYDNFGPDFGGYWSLNDWITWHQALIATYGQTTANQKFIAAWNENGFGAGPINELEFSQQGRQYFVSSGLADLIDPTLFGLANDFFHGVQNVTMAGASATKTFSWVVPIAGIALVYFAVQALGKDPGGQAKKFAGAVGALY